MHRNNNSKKTHRISNTACPRTTGKDRLQPIDCNNCSCHTACRDDNIHGHKEKTSLTNNTEKLLPKLISNIQFLKSSFSTALATLMEYPFSRMMLSISSFGCSFFSGPIILAS